MNDYSDIFFLLAAMLVYSMLSLNVNRGIVLSNNELNQQEVEYNAIAIGQDIIDEARFHSRDEVTPGNSNFDWGDYTDCANPEEQTATVGNTEQYQIPYNVCMDFDIINSGEYDITVFVNSDYLNNEVTLQTKRYF